MNITDLIRHVVEVEVVDEAVVVVEVAEEVVHKDVQKIMVVKNQRHLQANNCNVEKRLYKRVQQNKFGIYHLKINVNVVDVVDMINGCIVTYGKDEEYWKN